MGPIQAFNTGLRRAWSYAKVWQLMYLATLIAVIPLAFLPGYALFEVAQRTVIQEIAKGIAPWQIVDFMQRLSGGLSLATDQTGEVSNLAGLTMGYLMLLVILVPLLSGVVSAFFWGGVLLIYHEAPQAFKAGRFWWGCWHWFGCFLLLALLQTVLALVGIFLLGVMFTLFANFGTVGMVIVGALTLLLLVFWMAWFELARVQCVVTHTRNPFVGLGRAFRLIFRRLPLVMSFYGLALLLLALVHGLFRGLVLPNIPNNLFLVAFIAQQGYIVLRLLAQAVRLAGLAAIAQSFSPASAGESAVNRGGDAEAVTAGYPAENPVIESLP